jgi:HD-like signal output (HDOD) protein
MADFQGVLTPLSATQTVERARTALQNGRGAGLPELLKLIETLTTNVGEATISDIAELIEKDTAVMSRLLTVANTIVHNPNVAPLSSVHHAIHQVGFQRIRSLAVSLMLIENTGGAGNPPEQRAAAAQALCAGLLAQGVARAQGTVDPEAAFAAAALRQFGHIILPGVSLEHYREARERLKTKPEDVAYRGMFGLTPLEVSRRLLAASHLPEEITRSLRDCQPEAVARMPVSNDTRLLGMADLGGRLAQVTLDASASSEVFGERTRKLARSYDRLLPGACDSLELALVHLDDRIASFTRCNGVSTLPLPGLDTIKSRVHHSDPAAPAPTPTALPAATVPATAEVAEIPAAGGDPVPVAAPVEAVASPPDAVAPPVQVGPPASAVDSAPVPGEPPPPPEVPWTEQLASSVAFETQAPEAQREKDPWAETLALVRDNFGADECWAFLPQAGGLSLPIRHGTGENWRRLISTAALRADERTVFGICLTRRENVVIHNTAEPSLVPYLPEWFRRADPRPGSFLLMPLVAGPGACGLVLIGWKQAQRLDLSAARTELARQALAATYARREAAAA